MVFNVSQSITPSGIFYPAPAGGNFDGTTTYLERTSTIYGSDSSQGVLALWVNTGSLSAAQCAFFGYGTGNGFIGVNIFTTGIINVIVSKTNTASDRISMNSNTAYTINSWIYLLASWDTNFSGGSRLTNLFINGINDKNLIQDTGSAFNFPYSGATHWRIGAQDPFFAGGNEYFKGNLSSVYFAPGTYIDVSVVSNRRKFISATKRPVFLGANGSLPTGSVPALFMQGVGTGFNVNSGTGGNFTTTGTLTTPTTTPSAP